MMSGACEVAGLMVNDVAGHVSVSGLPDDVTFEVR